MTTMPHVPTNHPRKPRGSRGRPARRSRRADYRGAAVVEFAVCLPVLMLLVTGAIELTNVIHIKQSLTATAYEAARQAVRPDATLSSTQAIADRVLRGHRIRNGRLTVAPGLTIP
ncbi:MAG TPA: TadE family protein, partial [Pirellulaceae bacterium]